MYAYKCRFYKDKKLISPLLAIIFLSSLFQVLAVADEGPSDPSMASASGSSEAAEETPGKQYSPWIVKILQQNLFSLKAPSSFAKYIAVQFCIHCIATTDDSFSYY